MAKVLSCRDVGISCDWHACGTSEEDVLQQAAEHARKDHGITTISDEMVTKVKSAIHDGICPLSVHSR
jgi:predicted small metal-binding protein